MGVSDPVLKDTGKKKKLTIQNSGGFQDTVIWSPYGNRAMGYEKFLCVESVAYDPVHLNPGDSWSASMTLIPGPHRRDCSGNTGCFRYGRFSAAQTSNCRWAAR